MTSTWSSKVLVPLLSYNGLYYGFSKKILTIKPTPSYPNRQIHCYFHCPLHRVTFYTCTWVNCTVIIKTQVPIQRHIMRRKRCFHLGKAHFNQNRGTYDTKGFPLHEMIQCILWLLQRIQVNYTRCYRYYLQKYTTTGSFNCNTTHSTKYRYMYVCIHTTDWWFSMQSYSESQP